MTQTQHTSQLHLTCFCHRYQRSLRKTCWCLDIWPSQRPHFQKCSQPTQLCTSSDTYLKTGACSSYFRLQLQRKKNGCTGSAAGGKTYFRLEHSLICVMYWRWNKNPTLIQAGTQQRGITLLPSLSDHNVLVYHCKKLRKRITVSTLEQGLSEL